MPHLVKNYRQFQPGMLVRITGTAGVYRGTTKFRFFASVIEPQGEGALQIAFDKLKAQLEAEGLFAPDRKRTLSPWPTRIGLITAKDSSAYFDLVKILSARMCGLTLKLLPVSVQGREAIPSILTALDYVNTHSTDFDVVILARGGGSLEDLQAFNSEDLARAVFSIKVPLVSAVGHEDNWSLTDYVADLRASTPSNAAELVVKDKTDVLYQIEAQLQLIKQVIDHTFHRHQAGVNQANLFIKQYSSRLNQAITSSLSLISQKTNLLLALANQDLTHIFRLIKSLDYQQVLNRGFSITTTASGAIVKSATQVQSQDHIITQLATGVIKSHVD